MGLYTCHLNDSTCRMFAWPSHPYNLVLTRLPSRGKACQATRTPHIIGSCFRTFTHAECELEDGSDPSLSWLPIIGPTCTREKNNQYKIDSRSPQLLTALSHLWSIRCSHESLYLRRMRMRHRHSSHSLSKIIILFDDSYFSIKLKISQQQLNTSLKFATSTPVNSSL